MLEYPKNYEEAKIIIKDSAYNDHMKSSQRKNLLRAGLVTSICLGVSALIGFKYNNMQTFIAALPLASMISLSSFIPYFVNNSTKRKIISGKMIEGKSEEEVIKMASMYVDEYNEFESKRAKR